MAIKQVQQLHTWHMQRKKKSKLKINIRIYFYGILSDCLCWAAIKENGTENIFSSIEDYDYFVVAEKGKFIDFYRAV